MNNIVPNYERYARVKSQIPRSPSLPCPSQAREYASFDHHFLHFSRHIHTYEMQTVANNYYLCGTIINFTKTFFAFSVSSSLLTIIFRWNSISLHQTIEFRTFNLLFLLLLLLYFVTFYFFSATNVHLYSHEEEFLTKISSILPMKVIPLIFHLVLCLTFRLTPPKFRYRLMWWALNSPLNTQVTFGSAFRTPKIFFSHQPLSLHEISLCFSSLYQNR